MLPHMVRPILYAALLTIGLCYAAEEKKPQPTFTEPAAAGPDYALQGEYEGSMREKPFALQVIALGSGAFDATVYPDGLPGKATTHSGAKPQRVTGQKSEDSTVFSGNGWRGTLTKSGITLHDFKGEAVGQLKRIERTSPSLAAKAPKGAVVLFDGSSLDAFKPGARKTEESLLMEGVTTQEEFGDCTIHIEFRTPFMPEARGQGRGNSGIYLAGRYEVQMLDSFGLSGENNECGGIYTVAKPIVNMCLPPLAWQTYDIDFTAPRMDEKGAKLSDATVTVRHNGVIIHQSVKLPSPTRAAPISTDGARGPIHLQNHGNPVRYRNIWVQRHDA